MLYYPIRRNVNDMILMVMLAHEEVFRGSEDNFAEIFKDMGFGGVGDIFEQIFGRMGGGEAVVSIMILLASVPEPNIGE